MKSPSDLDAAERRHLATHPLCVDARRRAEDAATALFRSLIDPGRFDREAAIEVLSAAGLEIAKAEQDALDAFRAERGRLYAAD